jgi:hypothetical protein
MINKTDISKFSFAEAMSNSNGKTSGIKLGAFTALVTSCIVFLIIGISAIYDSEPNVSIAALATTSITSSLASLAYGKNKATKDSTNSLNEEEVK